jgi:mono/diheme cytochrome c family protein
VTVVAFLVVAGLAWFARTPLEKEATAANLDGYSAVSEWYVLPLHALTILPPFDNVKLEPVATVVLPGLLVGAMIALPFLDLNPERRPSRRPAATAAGIAVIAATVGLCGYAYVKDKPSQTPVQQAAAGAAGATQPAAALSVAAQQGQKLFAAQSCDGCHSIAGKGGKVGPDLTQAGKTHGDPAWQVAHLIDPASKSPGSTMPSYRQLKKPELDALAAYLVSLK